MCYVRTGVGFWACQECRQTRKQRRGYVEGIRASLDACIPPLYRGARLGSIGAKVAAMMRHRFGAVLFGPTGTGKTHAVCAYLRSLVVTRQSSPVRVSSDRLLLEIREAFAAGTDRSELSILRPYLEADVMALEDIGAATRIEKAETDFANRVLLVLLDYRIEWLKPTIITTNKTQDSLAQSVNQRITSRLNVFPWIGIGGKDKRHA